MAPLGEGGLKPFQPQINPSPGEGLQQILEIDGGR
jgi:hypothetical protein